MSTCTKPTRWNPWPVSIIAFFTVAIFGCGSFVAFCNRHPAELVAADYYEQEIRYQGHIESSQRAQDAAKQATISYDAVNGRITLSLPRGLVPSTASGKIQLYRPSSSDQDRHLLLQPGLDGVQVIDATGLRPGLWKVRVSWTADQKDYYLDQKVVVGGSTF